MLVYHNNDSAFISNMFVYLLKINMCIQLRLNPVDKIIICMNLAIKQIHTFMYNMTV